MVEQFHGKETKEAGNASDSNMLFSYALGLELNLQNHVKSRAW